MSYKVQPSLHSACGNGGGDLTGTTNRPLCSHLTHQTKLQITSEPQWRKTPAEMQCTGAGNPQRQPENDFTLVL